MKEKVILKLIFFVVYILSLAFSIGYRENFLIDKDIYLNFAKIDKKADYNHEINGFSGAKKFGEIDKMDDFNVQIFSPKNFIFSAKNFSTRGFSTKGFSTNKSFYFLNLESSNSFDGAKNVNFSTFTTNFTSDFTSDFAPNFATSLGGYRFSLGFGSVYKLKKNLYIDFNTSFRFKNGGLENNIRGYSGGLQLEISPRLNVYIKF